MYVLCSLAHPAKVILPKDSPRGSQYPCLSLCVVALGRICIFLCKHASLTAHVQDDIFSQWNRNSHLSHYFQPKAHPEDSNLGASDEMEAFMKLAAIGTSMLVKS